LHTDHSCRLKTASADSIRRSAHKRAWALSRSGVSWSEIA
jgi:hypothetical protein